MTPEIRREVVYKHVVQDIIIPVDEMSRSIDLFHEWFEVRVRSRRIRIGLDVDRPDGLTSKHPTHLITVHRCTPC